MSMPPPDSRRPSGRHPSQHPSGRHPTGGGEQDSWASPAQSGSSFGVPQQGSWAGQSGSTFGAQQGSWVGPSGAASAWGSRGPSPSGRMPAPGSEAGRGVLPQVGEVFAGYRLERILGQGAMGRVYRGTNQEGRPAALKVMLEAPEDEEAVERFVREGRAMAAVPPHPNVLGVYGAGQDRGLLFLALELAEGGDLEGELAQGALAPEAALEAGIALADALAHVHQAGVIHRDLKPANALRRADGSLALADFGLARLQGARGLTQTGEMLGTPLYMAPEQVMAEKDVDGRADVWALGVILYRALSGSFPFQGANATETMQLILDAEPAPLRGLGGGYREVVGRALAKERSQRYAGARDMAHALRECLARGGAGSEEQLDAKLKRALVALVVLAVLLVGLSAAAWSYTGAQQRGDFAAQVGALEARAQELAGDCLARSGTPPQGAALEALAADLEALKAAGASLRGGADEFAPKLAAARASLARARWRAALGSGRLEEAEALAADESLSAQERTLLAQVARQARGLTIDRTSLEDVGAQEDELGAGAKVLLAAACLELDPRRANALLEGLPQGITPLAAPERRLAQAFLAVDQELGATLGKLRPSLSSPELAAVRGRALRRLDLLLEPLPPLPPGAERGEEIRVPPEQRFDYPSLTRRLECLGRVRLGSPEAGPVAVRLVKRLEQALQRGDEPSDLKAALTLLEVIGRAGLRVTERGDFPSFVGVAIRYNDHQAEIALAVDRCWLGLDLPLSELHFLGPATGTVTEMLGEKKKSSGLDPHERYIELRVRSVAPSREQAQAAAQDLVEFLRESEDAVGPLNRADLLAKLAVTLSFGREQRAQWAEEALRLDPASPWVLASHALTLAEAGREAEARKGAKRAAAEQLRTEPRYGTTSLFARRLVLAYASLGDVEQTNVYLRFVTTEGLAASVLAEAKGLLRAYKSKAGAGADPQKR